MFSNSSTYLLMLSVFLNLSLEVSSFSYLHHSYLSLYLTHLKKVRVLLYSIKSLRRLYFLNELILKFRKVLIRKLDLTRNSVVLFVSLLSSCLSFNTQRQDLIRLIRQSNRLWILDKIPVCIVVLVFSFSDYFV